MVQFRIYWVFFIGLLLSELALAQVPKKQQIYLDSLQQVISETPDLKTKVKTMGVLAQKIKLYDPDSCWAIGERAMRIGEESRDEEIMAIAKFDLAQLMLDGYGCNFDSAAAIFKETAAYFEREGNPKRAGSSWCFLCYANLSMGKKEHLAEYSEKGLALAKQSQDREAIIQCYQVKTFVERLRFENEAALDVAREGLAFADSVGDSLVMVMFYEQLGQIQLALGNRPAALKEFQDQLAMAEAVNDSMRMAMTYYSLMDVYLQMEEYEASKELGHKAIQLHQSVTGKDIFYDAYNAMGLIYGELDRRDSAIYFLKRSLNIGEGSIHPITKVSRLKNLVHAYFLEGQIDSLKPHLNEGLQIAEELEFTQGLILLYEIQANVLVKENKIDAALVVGHKGLKLSQKSNYKDGYKVMGRVLSEAYEQKRNYAKALEMHKLYVQYKDTLALEENIREISRIEVEYQYAREAELDSIHNAQLVAAAEAETVIQAQRNSYLWIGLVIVLLLAGLGYFLYLTSRRKNQLIASQKSAIEKQDQEKKILLKEIHHRVKNNLQVVSSLLELQSLELDDPNTIVAVEDGQNRVKAMALIHEMLYQNEDLSLIDFPEYARQLVKQIASIFPDGRSLEWEIQSETESLDIDTAIPVGLIMNELLTNIFKYVLPGGNGAKVMIQLKQPSSEDFQLDVRDNGPGLPEGFDLSKAQSLGLRLVRNLARQLYGSVEYHYDDGANFSISFKSKAARMSVN